MIANNIINPVKLSKYLLVISLLILAPDKSVAFTPPQVFITGPEQVCPLEQVTYHVNANIPILFNSWKVTGAFIIEQEDNYVTVMWFFPGAKQVELSYLDQNQLKQVYLSVEVQQVNQPVKPEVTLFCDKAELQREEPPADEIWYWQTTATGTDESNSDPVLTVYENGIYYLRAKNILANCWGASNPVNISLSSPSPPQTTDDILCGSGTAMLKAVPVNNTNICKWYTQPEGGNAIHTGTALQFFAKSDTTFFVSSYDDISKCESEARSPVSVTIKKLDFNSVTKTIVLEAGYYTEADLKGAGEDVRQNTEYYDGLGRLAGRVMKNESPANSDVTEFFEYNELGLQTKSYLPFTSSNVGCDFSELKTEQALFYQTAENIAHTTTPYAETEYEASPLNRVLRRGAPGEAWQLNTSHTVKADFRTNLDNEVRLWKYENNQWTTDTYYPKGKLIVNSVLDEHDNLTLEYKDFAGKLIVKKSQLTEGEYASILCLYDDFGNKRHIIQPEGVKLLEQNGFQLTEEIRNDFAFSYEYDKRKRIVYKKTPASGKVAFVYDKLNRPIFSQDGNQKENGVWSFTKYDARGRVIITGIYSDPGQLTREELQNIVDQQVIYSEARSAENYSQAHGYTNLSFPTENIEILTINYYDDYDFNYNGSSDHEFQPDDDFENLVPSTMIYGMATGSKSRVLGSDDDWITSIVFYDVRGREIQSVGVNHDGGQEITWNELDFTGKTLKTKHRHCIKVPVQWQYQNDAQAGGDIPTDYFSKKRKRLAKKRKKTRASRETNPRNDNLVPIDQFDPWQASECITTVNRFTYDHAGRMKTSFLQVDDGPEHLISEMHYNELGQLIRKDLGISDTSILQSVDYKYNIRGWLTHVNDAELSDPNDLFGYELRYDKGINKLHGWSQFNGNISAQLWKSKLDSVKRGYGYRYDKLNRMFHAFYAADDPQNQNSWTEEKNRFSTASIAYDLNGNITKTFRIGLKDSVNNQPVFSYIDQMQFGYDGNRLAFVNDPVANELEPNDFHDNGSKGSLENPEYFYDANGNMVADGNKGITVSYNLLNLPDTVNFGDGNKLVYRYDASGNKLQKLIIENNNVKTVKDYYGSFEYTNEQLDFIAHSEGFLAPDNEAFGGYAVNYRYADHLGNTRQIFRASVLKDTSWLATMELDLSQEEEGFFDNLPETRNDEQAFEGNHSAKLINEQGPMLIIDTVRQGERYSASVKHYFNNIFNPLPFNKGPEETSRSNEFNLPFLSFDTRTPLPPAKRKEIITIDPATGEQSIDYEVERPEQQSFGLENLRVNLLGLTKLFGNKKESISKNQQQQQQENNWWQPPPPQAYLRFELTDTSNNVIKSESIKVGKALVWSEIEHAIDIDFKSDTMKQGTLKIWVENLDPEEPVWFDNLLLESLKQDSAVIVQENHYRPFGNVIAPLSYLREGSKEYERQFNEMQRDDDFGLNAYTTLYRTYDPATGRWWQVDPKAESAYGHSPYNSMWNNPVSYSDPEGDFAMIIGAAIGVAVNGIGNIIKGDNFFKGWAGAALGGALSGGYLSAVGSGISGHLPSANINLGGGFGLSISPAFMLGSQGVSIGVNLGASYTNGDFSLGISVGGSFGKSNITDKTGFSGLLGVGFAYDSDNFYGSLSTTKYFSGPTSQRTGTIGLGYGDFKVHYENDFHPGATPYLNISDGGDRFRTSAMRVSYGDFSAGFTLFTGDPGPQGIRQEHVELIDGYKTYVGNDTYKPDQYRFGAAYVGYKNYRAGWNSEGIRHAIQNRVAHDILTGGSSKHFRRLPSGYPGSFYGGTHRTNKYSLWE